MSIKKTLMLFFCVCISLSVFAQWDDEEKPFHFGLGTALSLPVGDLKDASKFGAGIEVEGNYAVSGNFETFLQTGVHVFKGVENYGDQASVLHIPALVGARIKAAGFFAGAGVGYGYFNGGDTPLSGFLYSPQVGYGSDKYQILAHYTATSVKGGSLSYFGIKVFRLF